MREERSLFRLVPGGFDDPRIGRLVAEHVALRDATDQLSDAARDPGRDGTRLTTVLDELVRLLDLHLRDEEEALAPHGARDRGARAQHGVSRTLVSLTEGRDLDLDLLPAGPADTAVLDRLMRMRPGDQVHVRSSSSLEPLWRSLQRHLSGEYGWTYLREGPRQWEAQLTRRTPGDGC